MVRRAIAIEIFDLASNYHEFESTSCIEQGENVSFRFQH